VIRWPLVIVVLSTVVVLSLDHRSGSSLECRSRRTRRTT